MKTSLTIEKISPALLKAQIALESVKKGATNPFYKSLYADLPSVIEAVKKPLNDNGISYLQPVCGDRVETVLVHSSGEWIGDEGTPIATKSTTDPQATMSAISYARRYGLQSILGLPAVDDDAEKAMNRKNKVKEVLGIPKEEMECESCGLPLSLKNVEYYEAHPAYQKLCFNCSQKKKTTV